MEEMIFIILRSSIYFQSYVVESMRMMSSCCIFTKHRAAKEPKIFNLVLHMTKEILKGI